MVRLRIIRTGRTPTGVGVHTTIVRVGRNDRCPCGSGRKLKRCCLDKITAPTTDN